MEFKEVQSGSFMKWTEVGDEVVGIYNEVMEQESQISGEMQKIYSLTLEDGSEVRVGGRPSIDAGMRRVSPGTWVKIKFEEEVPSKTKGNNPFKRIVVYEGPKADGSDEATLPI